MVATTSALSVVCATAVVVAAAASDPAVATRTPSVSLDRVQDVVTGAATPGVDAVAAVATALPSYADLAATAVSAQTVPTATPKRLQVRQRYGIDVSWPQCGTTLPTIQLDFAVIGLTDGHAESVSPCFAEQVAWAKANHVRVAVYVVPNSPGTSASAAMRTATPAPCTSVDASCPTYADGVRQARHALAAAAAAQLPRTGWWLDVEESAAGTLWGTDTIANSALLRGWVDTLRAAKLPVGAYSTHGYWTMITGGWDANLPQWVPVGTDGITDAELACAEPFTSGPVVMTQWLTGPYDGNLLCPTPDGDPMARAFTGKKWPSATTAGVPALLTTPVPHPELEQAQAEQDAESACDDPAGDDDSDDAQRGHRVAADPSDLDDCPADDDPATKDPKTKGSGDGKGKGKGKGKAGKTPKAKGPSQPKAQHASKPKPSKGKHHKG